MQTDYRNITERDRQPSRWWGVLESFVIVGLTLGVGFLSHPQDPFFIHAEFPWLAIAMVLVALRYGFLYGVGAVFGVIVLYVVIMVGLENEALRQFPYVFFVGLAILTMIAGEFRDYWQKNIDVLKYSNAYRQLRLDEFTRSFHLLKMSHDQLQMRLGECGQNVREVLQSLLKLLSDRQETTLTAPVAERILGIMADHGYLHRAAVVKWSEEDEALEAAPVAHIGEPFSVEADDDLVRACLATRQLVSVRPDGQQESDVSFSTRYQVVVPIVDSEGHFYGIVVVMKMSFFALEARNLRLLAVLAGSAADYLNYARLIRVSSEEDEQCLLFRINLKRAIYNRRHHGVPGQLVIMRATPSEAGQAFVRVVEEMRRGLDLICRHETEHAIYLLLLLPVTDEIGLRGYFSRLENTVKERLGQPLQSMPVQMWHVETKDEQCVRQLVEQAEIEADVARV